MLNQFVIEAMAKILKGRPASPIFRPIREIIITYYCLLGRFCFGILLMFSRSMIEFLTTVRSIQVLKL